MIFKKKRGIFSDNVDVSKICATCRFASPLYSTEDFMCSKKGLVSAEASCKRYEYNRLMKRPPKKHNLNTDRFSPEDFEI